VATSASAYLLSVRPAKGVTVGGLQSTEKIRHLSFLQLSGRRPSGVAWILFNGQRIFGRVTSFWGPLAVLMLFVVSATIVGSLVLGRLILLYLDGKKNEALRFFDYTVGWLATFTLVVFLIRFWK
jgi:hypothetical protein